jgi:hypothetical protein
MCLITFFSEGVPGLHQTLKGAHDTKKATKLCCRLFTNSRREENNNSDTFWGRFITCVDKTKQIQAEQVVCAGGGNFHWLQVKFRDRRREMCVRFQQPSAREWPSTVIRCTIHCTNIALTDRRLNIVCCHFHFSGVGLMWGRQTDRLQHKT